LRGARRLSPSRKTPGPKGSRDALIQAIVELKSRNPRFGCPRIARTIAQTFGIDVDKNVVYRQWRGCSEWRRDAGSTSQSRTCRTDSRLLLIIRLAIPYPHAPMSDQPSLAGPIARIDRADELLQQLDAGLNAFLRSSPYEVEEIPDPDEQTRAFVLRKLHDVPARPFERWAADTRVQNFAVHVGAAVAALQEATAGMASRPSLSRGNAAARRTRPKARG
jgi:hypothetical protein